MYATKKFDRLRQWGREKIGTDSKTASSEEFKAMEQEMNVRHEGMEKLHESTGAYVKHISKKSEGESKEKGTPVALLAGVMQRHGQELEQSSNFGKSLAMFGECHTRIARIEETYATKAKSSWLDTCAKSLTMLKDYQNARKKLESRRLAYDTTLAKMQKAKKEDVRIEEDIRAQKAKYEESMEDVARRMEDIVAADDENMTGLDELLEAEMSYHAKCLAVLQDLKKDLPSTARTTIPSTVTTRSRQSSLGRFQSSSSDEENSPHPEPLRVTRGAQPVKTFPSNSSPKVERLAARRTCSEQVTSQVTRTRASDSGSDIGRSEESTDDESCQKGASTTSSSSFRSIKKVPPPPPPSRSLKPSVIRSNTYTATVLTAA